MLLIAFSKLPKFSLLCSLCSVLFWHYSCPILGQREWSGKKVIFFLSLICLHIFLLFSVCTHRPSFFLSLAVPFFKKIVLMSSFCTKLRSPKCSHRLTMLRFRRLASQACPPCGSAKGASALCSRSAASVRTKIISSPPILNEWLRIFNF